MLFVYINGVKLATYMADWIAGCLDIKCGWRALWLTGCGWLDYGDMIGRWLIDCLNG